jgi:hypothetical protein
MNQEKNNKNNISIKKAIIKMTSFIEHFDSLFGIRGTIFYTYSPIPSSAFLPRMFLKKA